MVIQLRQVANVVRIYASTKLSELRHMVIGSYERRRLSGRMELVPIRLTLNIFPHERYLERPLCFGKIGSLAGVELLFEVGYKKLVC